MRKASVIAIILAAGTAIALSGLPAYAGSAGGPGSLPHMECYLLESGQTANKTVDLFDQFNHFSIDPDTGEPITIPDRARVGTARLLCTIATKFPVDFVPFPAPVDSAGAPVDYDHLTCYDLQRRNDRGRFTVDDPRVRVELTNQLGVDTSVVRFSSLLCVPTFKRVLETPAGR